MTSWGTIKPDATKFTYGRKEDTPWNWDLNWKDYVRKEKGYSNQWSQARAEREDAIRKADELFRSGKVDFGQRASGKSYKPQMRTVFGVAGSFISEPVSPLSQHRLPSSRSEGLGMSRYGGGMDSGRGGAGAAGAGGGMRQPGPRMSNRAPMSFRSSARGSVRTPTARTGRSIASGSYARGAGGSTTRSERERLDVLAQQYAEETARRRRMETRVLELEAELSRLHGDVAPVQDKANWLQETGKLPTGRRGHR